MIEDCMIHTQLQVTNFSISLYIYYTVVSVTLGFMHFAFVWNLGSQTLPCYIYIYRPISLVGRVFANGTVDQSSVSYQRLKKWYLILPCLIFSIKRYGPRVKWSNPVKRVASSPTPQCSRKGMHLGHLRLQSPTLHIYMYIYICASVCVCVNALSLVLSTI